MKRYLLKYSLIIALAAFSVSLFAAPASARWFGKESSEKKVEHIKKELSLTDDQTSQVKAIYDDTTVKIKALRKEKEDRISAVLTPEQLAKYAKKKKE